MNNSPIKCSIPKVKLSFSTAEFGGNDTSLTQAINNYREANRRFDELPSSKNTAQENAMIKWTYERPMEVLCAWNKPAQSLEEVHEALKIIRDDQIYIDSYGDALFKAVLGYFEVNIPKQQEK